MSRIEEYFSLYNKNTILNYITLYSYFLFVSLWYSSIGYGYFEFYKSEEFNIIDFSLFFLLVSLFLYLASNIVCYFYLQHKNKVFSLLVAKKTLESKDKNINELILKINDLSLLYNVEVPDLFILESDNFNIALIDNMEKPSIVITDKMLSRVNDDELEFILSCQFVRILNKNYKELTKMSLDLFFITSIYSFGSWLKSNANNKYFLSRLKYILGTFLQLLSIPAVLLIKEQERTKTRESYYAFKQVSFVTGIPIGLKGFVRSLNDHNKNHKIDRWPIESFSNLFDFNTGSNNIFNFSFIDRIEENSNIDIVDILKVDRLILEDLSTTKGCISLYYSMLMPNGEFPVNLHYKNKTRKIKFNPLMLPFIIRSITRCLHGNIKQKTINILKCDLMLVSSYTNNLNLENLIACNEIVNNLYGIRTAYNYGLTNISKAIDQDCVDSDFLLDTINYLKLNENLKNECVLDIFSKIDGKINMRTLMILYSFGYYVPMSFVDK